MCITLLYPHFQNLFVQSANFNIFRLSPLKNIVFTISVKLQTIPPATHFKQELPAVSQKTDFPYTKSGAYFRAIFNNIVEIPQIRKGEPYALQNPISFSDTSTSSHSCSFRFFIPCRLWFRLALETYFF